MRSVIAFAICVAIQTAASSAPRAGDEGLAQEVVFGRQHLDNIAAPVTLSYSFERNGSLLGDVEDRADLVITAIAPDGGKRVEFRLFSGPDERHLEPRQTYHHNPMIVAFLQRDVVQMGRITGGSPHYFRNRIREAFTRSEAVAAESETIPFRGDRIEATKVTLEPFVRDPNLPRFPQFRHKRYEFVLAPEIPGGVYSLRALTPNGAAEPLLDEKLTYSGKS